MMSGSCESRRKLAQRVYHFRLVDLVVFPVFLRSIHSPSILLEGERWHSPLAFRGGFVRAV
jgi:hypothetical protein